jgi:hypothetical protein
VFKLIKIKQEVSDETVYHDAVDYPVDEEEDEINDDCDDGSDGEDEENDADNDQGSPPGHDSRCVTSKIFQYGVCMCNFLLRHVCNRCMHHDRSM